MAIRIEIGDYNIPTITITNALVTGENTNLDESNKLYEIREIINKSGICRCKFTLSTINYNEILLANAIYGSPYGVFTLSGFVNNGNKLKAVFLGFNPINDKAGVTAKIVQLES